MHTMIEPRTKKYVRNGPVVNMNKTNMEKNHNEDNSFEFPAYKIPSKGPYSSSNNSRVSYQTSKLNNLTAYY